jgi:predicted methyltransferase MtxX (methanogen marker protein 4)
MDHSVGYVVGNRVFICIFFICKVRTLITPTLQREVNVIHELQLLC